MRVCTLDRQLQRTGAEEERFDREAMGEEGSDALVSLSPSSVCDH